jgi:ABC-type multidrug transport system fused ATPase/permease subunit
MRRHHHLPIDSKAPPPRLTWGGLREAAHLLAYLLPYRRKFVAAHLCLLVGSLAGLAFPFFTGRLIDGASRGLGGLSAGAGWALEATNINTTALLLMLVLAVQAICSSLQTYWLAEVGERSLADLRRDTYARLIRLPMAFFAQRRVGELTNRLAADLSLMQQTLTGSAPQLIGQLVVRFASSSLYAAKGCPV